MAPVRRIRDGLPLVEVRLFKNPKGVVPPPHRRIEVDIPVLVEEGCNAVDVRVQSKRIDVFEDVHAEDGVEAPVNVEREQITIKY